MKKVLVFNALILASAMAAEKYDSMYPEPCPYFYANPHKDLPLLTIDKILDNRKLFEDIESQVNAHVLAYQEAGKNPCQEDADKAQAATRDKYPLPQIDLGGETWLIVVASYAHFDNDIYSKNIRLGSGEVVLSDVFYSNDRNKHPSFLEAMELLKKSSYRTATILIKKKKEESGKIVGYDYQYHFLGHGLNYATVSLIKPKKQLPLPETVPAKQPATAEEPKTKEEAKRRTGKKRERRQP